MNHKTFLADLRRGRAAWEATLTRIPQPRMIEPAFTGGWSVKDVIAHVTWFEREIAGVIENRALLGSELWQLPPDERNQAIFEENQQRPLTSILVESEAVGKQLLQLAETLTDEELNDPTNFADMPSDWVPWQLIAENSFHHYPAHIADIETWLVKISD